MGYAVLKIRISFNSDSARYLTRRERKKIYMTFMVEIPEPLQSESPKIQWLNPDSELLCLFFFPSFFGVGVKKTIEAWTFRNRSLLNDLCTKVILGENWFLILIVNNPVWLLIYSLPCSSVHGILQARILEWVATPFSRGSSQPMIWTKVSNPGLLYCRWILYYLSH